MQRTETATPPTAAAMQKIASAYSTAVFKGIGSTAGMDPVAARLRPVADLVADPTTQNLADAFAAGEQLLRQHYRNEYLFKNDLVSRIVFGRHSPRTTSALLEIPMGRSCADLMILNGTSTIYEVKTDLDQFDRLASQLATYATRAEYVNVVVGEKRTTTALSKLPDGVGLLVARKSGAISTVRPATSNANTLDIDHLYQLLRLNEAQTVLHRLDGYTPDVPRGHSWKRMRELFAQHSAADIHAQVVAVLKDRGTVAAFMTADPLYPPALRALAYGASPSNAAATRTMERLQTPIAHLLAI